MAVRGQPMQQDPDDKTAHDRNRDNEVPVEPGGKAVQRQDVVGSVDPGLQLGDADSEQDRRAASDEPEHQRQDPELELARAARQDERPGPAQSPSQRIAQSHLTCHFGPSPAAS